MLTTLSLFIQLKCDSYLLRALNVCNVTEKEQHMFLPVPIYPFLLLPPILLTTQPRHFVTVFPHLVISQVSCSYK